MPAPKGNKFWMIRDESGRKPIFDNPGELWNRATEYFQWCDDNPWMKHDFKGKDVEEVLIPTQRPYTQSGLCVFLNISEDTFRNYSDKSKHKDFLEVTSRISKIIYTQKYEGAAVGAFNANIIARDLGLAEKKEVEKSTTHFTPAEREARIKELKQKLNG